MIRKCLPAILAILLIAGCQDATAKYNPETGTDELKKNELIQFNDYAVTKEDVYNIMFYSNGANTAYNLAETAVLDKEVEVTEDMKNTAKSNLDFYKQIYGDSFEPMLQDLGITEEEYAEKYLTLGSRRQALLEKYIDDHFDKMYAEYTPMNAIVIPVSAEDTSDKIVEGLKGGKTIVDLVNEYNISASTDPAVVLNTNKTYPESVIKAIMSEKTAGKWIRVKIATPDNDMNGAVAYIILSNKMNPETDKDSITQALNNDESISGKIMGFYFDKYKFVMHDVNLKNAFESEYPNVTLSKN